MQLSPRLLGAAAAVLLAGVSGGAVLGKVPQMQQRGVQEMLPQASVVHFESPQQASLPDHYPIVTPQGRFEVHELRDRGLYRQARYVDPYQGTGWDVYAGEYDDPQYAAAPEPMPRAIEAAQTVGAGLKLEPQIEVLGEAPAFAEAAPLMAGASARH
jgi:hypothetical protein